MQQKHFFIILTSILLSTCMAAGAMFMLPATAEAHAFVTGSDPVDGSTINKMPGAVRIFFNAPVNSLSSVHIYFIKNGQLIDISAAPAQVSTSNARELTTAIKSPTAQLQGSYEVSWTAVAEDDGHTTYGIIGFNLGFSSTGASSGTTILGPGSSNNLTDIRSLNDYTSILLIVWDWFTLSALILWLGILIIELVLQQDKGHSAELLVDSRKRSYPLQWFCLSILLCGEIILPILRVTRLADALKQGGFSFALWWNLLFSTNYGHIWFVRIGLILCATGLLYRSRHTAAEHAIRPAWISLLPALLIVGTYALTRDAAQVLTPHISAIIFDWFFLLAQGIWFGGFFYLGFLLLPLLINSEQSHQKETLITLRKRLMPLLLSGMAILVISALFLSEASISNPQQLTSDPYGRTLLVQSGILLVTLLLSLYALWIIKPGMTQQALQIPIVDEDRSVRSMLLGTPEHSARKMQSISKLLAGTGAAILFCTALLSFYAPPIVFPKVTYTNPTDQATTSTQTQQIGSFSVTLQILPGKSGVANTVVMTINDQNGQAVTDVQVTLTSNMQIMDMGTGHATINPGNALYSATFPRQQTFDMGGLWNIGVTIQRPGQPSVQGIFQVMITA